MISLSTPVLLAAILLSFAAVGAHAAEPREIPLWPPDKTRFPEPEAETVRQLSEVNQPDRGVGRITWPTLTVHLPPGRKPAVGIPAVIVCPGGGYAIESIDREGHDVARWLNTQGCAGIVLKYRLPRTKEHPTATPWPFEDATRAVRFVRSRAQEWGIDPTRVGIMGFSAGGHLASAVGTHFDAGRAGAADPVERQSSRPDFMILVYPVISLRAGLTHAGSRDAFTGGEARLVAEFSNDEHVTPQTPPAFIAHAKDDPGVKPENSQRMADALKRAGVPCELMWLKTGGHGFGLGEAGQENSTWPARCAEWLRRGDGK